MEQSAHEFWSGRQDAFGQTSSNATLFRFLGQAGFDFTAKKVLEIGFGFGSDLLEAKRRGAEIYGIDLNSNAVESFKAKTGLNTVRRGNPAREPVGFGESFDAIYSRDTIYYLSDGELAALARNCFDALKPGGLLMLHFIQGSAERPADDPKSARPVDWRDWRNLDHSFHPDNPIRLLDPEAVAGIMADAMFRLVGKKTVWETYGIEETLLQCNRYLLFSHPVA